VQPVRFGETLLADLDKEKKDDDEASATAHVRKEKRTILALISIS
jgi:hypothetical protein